MSLLRVAGTSRHVAAAGSAAGRAQAAADLSAQIQLAAAAGAAAAVTGAVVVPKPLAGVAVAAAIGSGVLSSGQQPSGEAQADWLARSKNWAGNRTFAEAASVTFAMDFRADADVQPADQVGEYWGKFGDDQGEGRVVNESYVVRDTTDGLASGACLRINVLAGKARGANGSAWRCNMHPTLFTSKAIGILGRGSYYIQFRLKIPASRLQPSPGGQGWKFLNIAGYSAAADPRNQSLSNICGEHVLNNQDYRSFPFAYHTNASCNFDNFDAPFGGSDFRLQPARDNLSGTNAERYCLYSDGPNYSGCLDFPVDEWVTFDVEIRVGTMGGTAGNRFRLWMTRAQSTVRQLLVDESNHGVGDASSDGYLQSINGLHFLTYDTGLNGQSVDTHQKWTEIIVSTKPIDLPRPQWTPPYVLPAPSQVLAVGTNTLNSVKPPGWTDGDWEEGFFNHAQGGAAFVRDYSVGGAYVNTGGSHTAPAIVSIVIFDFETGTWTRRTHNNNDALNRADDYHESETTQDAYGEILGQTQVPCPGHTNFSLVPVPANFLPGWTRGGIAYMTRMGVSRPASYACPSVHACNLLNGTWQRAGTNLYPRNSYYAYNASVWDDLRRRWWTIADNNISFNSLPYFDATDKTWKTTVTYPFPPAALDAGALMIYQDRYLICTGKGDLGWGILDLENIGAGWSMLSFNATPTDWLDGWVYFPPTGKFYQTTRNGGPTLRRVTPPVANPVTNQWTLDTVSLQTALPARTSSGGTSPTCNGGLIYVPSIKRLAWFPGRPVNGADVFLLNPEAWPGG